MKINTITLADMAQQINKKHAIEMITIISLLVFVAVDESTFTLIVGEKEGLLLVIFESLINKFAVGSHVGDSIKEGILVGLPLGNSVDFGCLVGL